MVVRSPIHSVAVEGDEDPGCLKVHFEVYKELEFREVFWKLSDEPTVYQSLEISHPFILNYSIFILDFLQTHPLV